MKNGVVFDGLHRLHQAECDEEAREWIDWLLTFDRSLAQKYLRNVPFIEVKL